MNDNWRDLRISAEKHQPVKCNLLDFKAVMQHLFYHIKDTIDVTKFQLVMTSYVVIYDIV